MKKVRIIALIAAVATGLLVYVFLKSLSTQSVVEVQKTAVVVAVMDIPADTAISEDKVTDTQLPTEAVASGAISNVSQVIGRLARNTIYTGEQLLSAKLITAGDTENDTLAYAIEPGMRAITIAVSATSGLSNMITPGDHIDIIGEFLLSDDSDSSGGSTDTSGTASSDTGGDTTGTQTSMVSKTVMVLENITVLAVDSTLSASETGAVTYSTITLQVTPDQAMQLSMAQYEGELRAILRSPLDEDSIDPPSLTLEDVVE